MRLGFFRRFAFTVVSIHASVKDATDSILPKWLTYRVSIHASVKDATNFILSSTNISSFNPRICKRCDQKEQYHPWFESKVSIHASVKDATFSVDSGLGVPPVSIHASVKDATFCGVSLLRILRSFNPRICKRCDNIKRGNLTFFFRFNPRICKRCDCS